MYNFIKYFVIHLTLRTIQYGRRGRFHFHFTDKENDAQKD
jgi:hypothetical protein